MKRQFLITAAIVVAFNLLAVTFGVWWFGSIQLVAAYLKGHRVAAPPAFLEFTSQGHGNEYCGQFEVVNLSSKSVRIVGSRTNCSCVRVIGLPKEIPPFGRASIDVRCLFSGHSKELSEAVVLIADTGSLNVLTTRISAVLALAVSDTADSKRIGGRIAAR